MASYCRPTRLVKVLPPRLLAVVDYNSYGVTFLLFLFLSIVEHAHNIRYRLSTNRSSVTTISSRERDRVVLSVGVLVVPWGESKNMLVVVLHGLLEAQLFCSTSASVFRPILLISLLALGNPSLVDRYLPPREREEARGVCNPMSRAAHTFSLELTSLTRTSQRFTSCVL
jgi:hypothetical protein